MKRKKNENNENNTLPQTPSKKQKTNKEVKVEHIKIELKSDNNENKENDEKIENITTVIDNNNVNEEIVALDRKIVLEMYYLDSTGNKLVYKQRFDTNHSFDAINQIYIDNDHVNEIVEFGLMKEIDDKKKIKEEQVKKLLKFNISTDKEYDTLKDKEFSCIVIIDEIFEKLLSIAKLNLPNLQWKKVMSKNKEIKENKENDEKINEKEKITTIMNNNNNNIYYNNVNGVYIKSDLYIQYESKLQQKRLLMEKQKLDKLVESINAFDLYYEYSDSYRVTIKYTPLKTKLKEMVNDLNKEQLQYLIDNLTNNGKLCYDRYFKTDRD